MDVFLQESLLRAQPAQQDSFQWIPFPLELRLVPNRLSKDGRRHIAPLYFDSLRSILTNQKSVAAAISSYDASSSSCDRRAGLRLNRSALYFPCAFRYCSSLTFSSHSLEQFTPGASIEKCENQLSDAAPCQCLTPVGMFTQSPGYISTASLPHS